MTPKLTQLVFECDNPARLAEFWQQMHFDLLVVDLDAVATMVELAGGTPLTDVMDPGPKAWRIFADPAGHPFCLVSVPE